MKFNSLFPIVSRVMIPVFVATYILSPLKPTQAKAVSMGSPICPADATFCYINTGSGSSNDNAVIDKVVEACGLLIGAALDACAKTATGGLPISILFTPSPIARDEDLLPKNNKVPEPISVVGTLIGGAAVWRMRKKLTAGCH